MPGIGEWSKTLLKELDKVQYQAIRVALWLMKTTRIKILISERGEIPLRNRKTILALRYVAKIAAYDNITFRNLQSLHNNYKRDFQF